MSIPTKVTVKCPNCNRSITVTKWDSINTDLMEGLADKIISNEFFTMKCAGCGHTTHLEYDTLYHDIKRQVMIWVISTSNPNYQKRRAEIRNMKMPIFSEYRTRIVSNIDELREKVSALEAGRDDRLIELYKEYLKYELSKQYPHFITEKIDYIYARHNPYGQQEIFLAHDVNKTPIHHYLIQGIYESVTEQFIDRLQEEEFAVYDAQWACDLCCGKQEK